MNEFDDPNVLVETPEIVAPPEHLLWLAVIDRAMMDYVNSSKDITISVRRDLTWFFFEPTPEPHNLRWICLLLFGDISLAKKIVARIKTLKSTGSLVDGAYRLADRRVPKRKLPPVFFVDD